MSVKPFLSAADCLWHWRGHSRARANVHHGHDRCGDVWRSHASLKYSLAIAAPIVMMIFLAVSTAEAITYGGSATGAQVTISATNTTIRAVRGSLSILGGGSEAALLVGDIPGSVTGGAVSLAAGVMHASIVGLDAARAEASMANVTLNISNNQITSDFIMARGTASCGPAVSGDSTLTNLVTNGQAITVTGSPNQTVSLPNGTVVINQQTSANLGTSAAINVYAFHVSTFDPVTGQPLAEAVLAAAQPQIDCQGGPQQGFGTGGGWVVGDNGGKATFGVVGGVEPDGSCRGHLVFDDHSVGFTMQSTSITSVQQTGCQTTIQGKYNNDTTDFTVTITDSGEPGAGNDRISLNATVYSNLSEVMAGGNIQSHPNCHP